MMAWSISLLFANLSVVEAPAPTFDHRRFCEIMQVAASLPSTQPGTRIQKNIHHGGVLVHCDDRAVEIRTVLHTPLKALGKGWLTIQKRHWRDDNCSDPLLAGAVAHGWSLKAVILEGSNEAASFVVSCASQ
jgi:hypothetical protein